MDLQVQRYYYAAWHQDTLLDYIVPGMDFGPAQPARTRLDYMLVAASTASRLPGYSPEDYTAGPAEAIRMWWLSVTGIYPDSHAQLVLLARLLPLAVDHTHSGPDTDVTDLAVAHTLLRSAAGPRHLRWVSTDCTDPNSPPAREVAVAVDTGCLGSMTWLMLSRDRYARGRVVPLGSCNRDVMSWPAGCSGAWCCAIRIELVALESREGIGYMVQARLHRKAAVIAFSSAAA